MSKSTQKPTAILALESGHFFPGISIGAKGEKCGEVVFNTSMTGYQEILSDPSYQGQIILMTEPHIGNVGVNAEDQESKKIFCSGFIIRELSPVRSNWRSEEDLSEYLISQNIPAISNIDTRKITRILRDTGAMKGIISTTDFDQMSLLKKMRTFPSMQGSDLVKMVTCKKAYLWKSPEWKWSAPKMDSSNGHHELKLEDIESQDQKKKYRVVLMDFGAKHNISRCLVDRGCEVNVVPANTSAQDILSYKPHGIMLSNGPGDPEAVHYAIRTIQELIDASKKSLQGKLSIFGICLGHQLLSLALGGKTFKLKFGHHSSNHPVKNLATGKIEITAQNHGFCVDLESLKDKDIELTHINLNDGTLEGLKHRTLPIFSVQYHPESSGGPRDSRYLFDEFMNLMEKNISINYSSIDSQTTVSGTSK